MRKYLLLCQSKVTTMQHSPYWLVHVAAVFNNFTLQYSQKIIYRLYTKQVKQLTRD